MVKLEQAMKDVAVALTGKKESEIPESLEEICTFIAENYRAPAPPPFKAVTAPTEAAAAPTREEFNGLIEKLKETKLFK